MEIHVQKCQACNSRNLRNILVRDEKQKVFVQCRECEQLVARYVLAPRGYFHKGKGFESFLRSIERDGGSQSGRHIEEQFNETEKNAEEEFKHLMEEAKKYYGNGIP